ncbi:MAG: DNA primase [Tissierellaceae bacterium]
MTFYVDNEIVEKVREASDIVDIVSGYLALKKSGSNYVGLCPFHSEKTPSFTVSDSKQFFHCFGCGEGGDVVTFIMKRENLSFPEAVKFLAEKAGIEVEEKEPKDLLQRQEKEKAYEINKEAARYFFKNLSENKDVLDYLYRRKIGNKQIRQFGLGYALNSWDALYKHLQGKGYKDEEIYRVGLIGKRSKKDGYYDKFRSRIIFPIIDTRGRVIAFGGRVLDNSMPKYLNSQETYIFNKGNNLYGLNLVNNLSDRKRIIIVEGYMDVIAMFNKGINYAVASLGTALTEKQARLLKRYGEKVYICYDTDKAGTNATLKAIQLLRNEGVEPRIIFLGKYKDPDDYFRDNSIEDFENKIDLAYNHIDYKILISRGKYDLEEAEGKIKFTTEIARVIKDLKSPIEQDVYIEKIAKDTNISKEAIEKEVFGNTKKAKSGKSFENKNIIRPINTILPLAGLTAEIDLIKLMIFDKDYFEEIRDKVSVEDFESLECIEMYKLIKELYTDKELISEDNVKDGIRAIENVNQQSIEKMFARELKFSANNVNNMIKDLILTLKTNKLENKRNKIRLEIEEMEKNQNKDSLEEKRFVGLCMELTNLNKELNLIKHEEGR